MHRALASIVIVAALVFSASIATAQDYPNRNVTFVVPTGAGAATDLLARILAAKLSDRLGKSFVVENRPGAGTVIAASSVAKALPDGDRSEERRVGKECRSRW